MVNSITETFEDGGITVVLSRVGGKNGLRRFDDEILGSSSLPSFDSGYFAVRHAASAKPRDVYVAQALVAADPPFPSFPALGKGKQFLGGVSSGSYVVWLSRPGELEPWVDPRFTFFLPDRLYQHILIGTKPRNYRFVRVSTPFTPVLVP